MEHQEDPKLPFGRKLTSSVKKPLEKAGQAVKKMLPISNEDDDEKQLRWEILDTLSRILKTKEPYIEPSDNEELRISVFEFSGTEQNENQDIRRFFEPWSREKVQGHPINQEDEFLAQKLRDRGRRLDHGPTFKYPFPWDTRMRVESLCGQLIQEFSHFPRMGTPSNEETFCAMSGMRGIDFHPFDRDLDSRNTHEKPEWNIRPTWTYGRHTPHVKMMMWHNVEGISDKLLRGELRAIVTAMKERLKSEDLKKHVIIPVMVFSLAGRQHGRILIAYFDGRNLIIQKSKFVPFFSRNMGSFSFFMRYMGGGITGEDTTKI